MCFLLLPSDLSKLRQKELRLISVYPSSVFFNIRGMSAFICLVLCYSRNARFCVSNHNWAPGESAESKGSPKQCAPPSSYEPPTENGG